jgi:glycine betaine/proline transport system substrate-binding protein
MILEDGMEPEKAARLWLQKNPTVLDKWLKGVTTRDGHSGYDKVQNDLK